MELHPILEKYTPPKPGLWYVLSALGDCPSVRVGHTCSYIPGQNVRSGKVYVIGGANPSGSFGDTFILDLDTLTWDISDAPGFKARYEHTAFVPESLPTKIYIFGGADQGKNNNDLQMYDTEANTWTLVSAAGSPPSPRTYHTIASAGNKLYVYSGGHCGSDPVGDRQLHCFDATTERWSIINARGDSPKPRHGHAVAVVGQKLIVHGGMAGSTFYDDLNILDLDKLTWKVIKQKKIYPCARAAHGCLVHGQFFYIFAGMNRNGALDDAYRLDTVSMKWSPVEIQGPPPACRLDFGMCHIRVKFTVSTEQAGCGVDVQDQTAEAVAARRRQAKEVLEQQLRLGSAGSLRSLGSAGEVRLGSASSMNSATPESSSSRVGSGSSVHSDQLALVSSSVQVPSGATAHQSSNEAVDGDQLVAGGASGINHTDEVSKVDEKSSVTVDLCLVLGGMDTEGEIFEDALVLPLIATT